MCLNRSRKAGFCSRLLRNKIKTQNRLSPSESTGNAELWSLTPVNFTRISVVAAVRPLRSLSSAADQAVEIVACRSERRFCSEQKLIPKHLPKRLFAHLARVRSEVQNHARIFQRTELTARTEQKSLPFALPFGFSSMLMRVRTEERNWLHMAQGGNELTLLIRLPALQEARS